jgi:hypothetical protein
MPNVRATLYLTTVTSKKVYAWVLGFTTSGKTTSMAN